MPSIVRLLTYSALIIAAPTWSTAQVTRFEPAGFFAFEAPVEGGKVVGSMGIARDSAGRFGGTLRWIAGAGPDSAAVTAVRAAGDSLIVVGENPAGRWTLDLRFVADSFHGTYQGPQAGVLYGRRLPFDPAGLYDYVAVQPGGRNVPGRIRIVGVPGAYWGTVTPGGNEPASITSVALHGTEVTIVARIPNQGDHRLTLRLNGEKFTGTFTSAEGNGSLSGRRADVDR